MEESQKQRLRDYARGYFALHAEQRMKTFNFYIILSTALISAFCIVLTRVDDRVFLIAIGFLLSLTSLLFWRLDCRNRQLVRNGENALKSLDDLENYLENKNRKPHTLKIFAYDDWIQSQQKCILISYSQIFASIFSIFGILGISICILSWVLISN